MKTQYRTVEHRTVEISPTKFAEQVPRDIGTEEYSFGEADVLKFLIDQMNTANINIAMINHDHELAIEYRGQRKHFATGITLEDAPADSVINGGVDLSCILNDFGGIESWIAYKNGKHVLHIRRNNEIAEAEDNIEASE